MPRRNYYQAGDNYGRAGNYAYQAGGIFSGIASAIGKVAKVAGGLLPGPIGTIARIGGGILAGAGAGRVIQAALPSLVPAPPSPGMIPAPGITGVIERALPGGASGYISGRRRRMDPMNVKALRRASRRLDSFARTARKALKHSPFMLVSRASRGRRGSPGVITRSEAARALKR
jgi:hypothetical protein